MRSKVVRTLALALLLGGISIAMGQQNPQGVDEKLKDLRGKEEADRAKHMREELRLHPEVGHLRGKVEADRSKHLALLKNKGELDWPESLQGSAFKDSREKLNALMQRAYKSLNSSNNPDSATLNELQVQWRKMRDILNKMVSELKPEEFIEATRYLQEAHRTITALQDPNIGHQFRNSSKGMGKGAAPAKSKLEEMLAEALKNNPDIRVADANVTLAEAELNRVRLQVTQKVVTLYHAIQSQQATVKSEQKQYDRMQGLLADRAINSTLVEERLAKLTAAKAKLEELEAQIPTLLGKSPQAEADAARALTRQLDKLIGQQQLQAHLTWQRSAKEAGPMTERLRKALQTPVKVQYTGPHLADVFKDLEKKVPGLSLRGTTEVSQWVVLDMHFEEALPVSVILQALADEFAIRFIVREYGVLATERKNVPPGGLTVEDFLRHKPADESRPQSRGGKNPPAENVEGVVKSIDASGLMTLTIGSDAGLAKGHTLELFRLNPSAPSQSKYLGTVRIVEAEARQCVARPVGRLSSPPQRGDRVASRILGK